MPWQSPLAPRQRPWHRGSGCLGAAALGVPQLAEANVKWVFRGLPWNFYFARNQHETSVLAMGGVCDLRVYVVALDSRACASILARARKNPPA